MSAPLELLWAALERAGCDPHGQPWQFRSKCPAHEGESRDALAVCEGVDRRVVLHCFAHGCDPRAIVAALGLSLTDLFPDGHRHARRVALPTVRRSDLDGHVREVANVLSALDTLGADWTARVDTACPYCGAERAQFVIGAGLAPVLLCPEDCTPRMFTGALAGRLRERQGAA